jgi:spermidine/putrescine transport system ATP-binding protein
MTVLDTKQATQSVISIRNVTKVYGEQTAVDGIDLDIAEGEFLSLLGPSGCGKTTLLRMIGGFEDPTAGDILLHSDSVVGVPPNKRKVNTVFQAYALFPHMTVAENVAYGLRQQKVPKAEIAERVGEALRLVRMSEFANREPKKLSGGQQQRVALARAIVNRPSVLLLDEPMSALDRGLREQMQVELKLIQRQVGITFVFVTHDQEEALSMSDRIVVMSKGRIEQVGNAQEVYENPATAFVAKFIGKQNFTRGTVVDDTTIEAEDATFRPPAGRLAGFAVGTTAQVAVRAESVTVSRTKPASDTNQVSGSLAGTSFLGDVLQYVVISPSGREVLVRTPVAAATPLEPGSPVWCTWDADAVQVFPDGEARA